MINTLHFLVVPSAPSHAFIATKSICMNCAFCIAQLGCLVWYNYYNTQYTDRQSCRFGVVLFFGEEGSSCLIRHLPVILLIPATVVAFPMEAKVLETHVICDVSAH